MPHMREIHPRATRDAHGKMAANDLERSFAANEYFSCVA
ncbi:hypothetical protein K788_0008569 (plasmid) [Paraburkholderia caribensis MBA4]|uniref:Uncharacterized protein n=1 Tax=Paraburkholderia caribensis MBA4 TaxID=1323664 RepID=A0A0P0RPU8_9BURK|nr:hypothetical protein K788_0008569 [Paraburkholderia caribensis MBA4]